MLNQSDLTLINQQNGRPAFKLFSFEGNDYFNELQRNNFFTLIWLMEGAGTINADFDGHLLKQTVFYVCPYQPYILQ